MVDMEKTLTVYTNTINSKVVMKPSPENIQELYLESLKLLGIDPLAHDIRFVEDNWENPSMGCAGLGWEVWLDGIGNYAIYIFPTSRGTSLSSSNC